MIDLHPVFRKSVTDWISGVKGSRGVDLLVFTTYRGAHDQMLEKAAGKSKASPWESAHQYGLGVDVVSLVAGKALWKLSDGDWRAIAEIGALYDIDWPGNRDIWMRRTDPYHFQHPEFKRLGAKVLLDRLRKGIDLIHVDTESPWGPPALRPDLDVLAPWEAG
jgi:hypothetical protein